jgi:lipoprotein NlpD
MSLIICCLAISCATRPDTAPIENATLAPSYLQAAKPTPPKPVAVANNTEKPASMSALDSDDDNVKPVVTQTPKPMQTNSPPAKSDVVTTVTPIVAGDNGFMIPSAGKTDGYKLSTKGIDIYGSLGQAVYASNGGKVVYSGNGLKGYGNLVIIKHSEVYLTAYAHNKTNLVKEGATVKRGQKIAEMGQDDSGRAVLHFELRKNGKPIDPFKLIKSEQ